MFNRTMAQPHLNQNTSWTKPITTLIEMGNKNPKEAKILVSNVKETQSDSVAMDSQWLDQWERERDTAKVLWVLKMPHNSIDK